MANSPRYTARHTYHQRIRWPSIGTLASCQLDIAVAEQVLGLTLDRDHAEIRALVADHPDHNEGRGFYCRCTGCGLEGFNDTVDWAAGCPTPPCPPYSTDLVSAWAVVAHLRAHAAFGAWFDAAHLWAADPATVPEQICRAALALASVTSCP
ncbi:MAG TPA: hypothetical protein VKY74_19085 [Chloroflexia bacterium]|nr:hypothetical protein [Chloroflexia bacterium]